MAHRVIYTFQGSPHLSPSLHQKANLGSPPESLLGRNLLLTRAILRLLPVALALPLAVSAAPAQAPEKPLTVEAIFAHGPLIGELPKEPTWSPDGKHLTYLDGGQLMDVDPATGKAHVLVSAAKMVPLNESGMSEHDRDHRQRYNMASYLWAPDSNHLLFDSNGALWLYDLHSGTGVQIGFTGSASGDDPKFSPDGSCVSFIRDHHLAVIRLREPGTPMTALAPAPNPADANGQVFLNGEIDWVYEEELDVHSNYFWSPDSKNLAYLQMNETQVSKYPLTDWIPSHAQVDWQRYPQPGDPNPEVHLGVVPARGGRTVWMQIPIHGGDDYVPRFGWVDRKTVWVETLSRDHKHRALYFARADYGDARQMLEIDDDKFVDENYDVAWAMDPSCSPAGATGTTTSISTATTREKPLAADANLEKQLTRGDFEVGDVYNVDTAHKVVDYASNEGNSAGAADLAGELRRGSQAVERRRGVPSSHLCPRWRSVHRQVLHAHDAAGDAPLSGAREFRLRRRSTAPSRCRAFWETHALDSYHLRAPEQFEVKAHDGTTLYATLLLPEGPADPATAPLIVNPYGGPHDQTVANRWQGGLLFDELLAQHGFAVLHADNRGMGSRGRAFAQAAYRNFGPVQLEDQLTVIDAALEKYPQLDPKRLGWWGWSWGGTFTLYALTHSDRFRAGVAVAPVTDWRNYDSIYTERYLGLPAEDPDAYRDFSVVNSAANLKGRLLLAHGTGDDNVHIENTVQFVQKLIEAGIPYDLQIFPRKTHSISGPDVQTQLLQEDFGAV